MIELAQVSKRYPNGTNALAALSLSLEAGELVFLTGHSGAGKSTLLKLLTLIERPTSGRVVVCQQDLTRLRGDAVARYRRRVGMVFQNHQLLFDRSVFHNVALPLEIAGMPRRDIAGRVRAALDKVGLLSKESMNPLALSGGEQQRVGIARAVVNLPAVLLADEPTGNLDPQLSAEIMALFRLFAGIGVTVMIATHDPALIEDGRHRVLQLAQGRLAEDRRPWRVQ
jgi:cell division transport system ATP-binding protein